MKKILILLSVMAMLFVSSKCFAASAGYDNAYYYVDQKIPVSGETFHNKGYKMGTSEAINVLGLVSTGDAGIKKACQNGDINKIYHVEQKVLGIYIFFRKYTTIVYGE